MASLPNSSEEVAEDYASRPILQSSLDGKLEQKMSIVESEIRRTGRFQVQRIPTPSGSTADLEAVEEESQAEIPPSAPLLFDPSRVKTRIGTNESDNTALNNEYEGIFEVIGRTGFWQLKNFTLHSLSGLFLACHSLVYILWIAASENSCSWGKANGNNVTSLEQLGAFDKDSNCSDSSNATVMENSTAISCPTVNLQSSFMTKDFAMDWDIVCTHPLKTSGVQAFYMLGMFVGLGYFTMIGDRFGPKRVIVIAILIAFAGGSVTIISTTFGALMFFRFCVGLGMGGIQSMSFALAMDTVPELWRRSATSYFNIFFGLGSCLLSVIGHYVKGWKQLQLLLSLPLLILLITCNLTPESPRWLILKGVFDEAEQSLRNAAKLNGTSRNVPDDFEILLHWIHEKERTIWWNGTYKREFFKAIRNFRDFPRLRFRCIVLCFCWGSIGMVYYGLTVSASFFDINVLKFLLIGGALEFPACILAPHLMKRCGRNKSLVWLLIVGGAASFILKFCSAATAIYLVFLAKLAIRTAYPIALAYSFELMPTVIRAYFMGIFSMMAVAGAAIAPLIVESLGHVYQPLPFMVFGVFALASGVILTFLPESETLPLPQTLEEAEVRANKDLRNPLCSFNWNAFIGMQRVHAYRDFYLV